MTTKAGLVRETGVSVVASDDSCTVDATISVAIEFVYPTGSRAEATRRLATVFFGR